VVPAVVKLYRGVWLFSAMVNSGQNHRKGPCGPNMHGQPGHSDPFSGNQCRRNCRIELGERLARLLVGFFVTDYLPVIGPSAQDWHVSLLNVHRRESL
jgi:hypothetical protein